jgi:hypothetical protein
MQVISARGEVEKNKESKQVVLEVQYCKLSVLTRKVRYYSGSSDLKNRLSYNPGVPV